MTDLLTHNPKGLERLVYVVWVRPMAPETPSSHNHWFAVGAFPNETAAIWFSRRYSPDCVKVLRHSEGIPPYKDES